MENKDKSLIIFYILLKAKAKYGSRRDWVIKATHRIS